MTRSQVELISTDCWDTILADSRHLDEHIDRLVAAFICSNFHSLSTDRIERAINVETEEFKSHLRRADLVITPTDRAARVLEIAGVATTDPRTQRHLAGGLSEKIDTALLEIPPKPLPGAIEFLRNATISAIPVVMLSNTGWISSRAVISAMRNLNLDSYFSDWFFSGDGYLPKPNPQMFELLLHQQRCHPTNALHVGDNPDTDEAGAIRTGIRSIIVDHGMSGSPVETDARLEEETRYRVHSLWDALPIVNALANHEDT